VAIDRQWNIVIANRSAHALLDGVPDHVLAPRVNVFRVCLHPDGLAGRTRNFAEWSAYLVGQMRRTIIMSGDAELASLEREVLAYGNLPTTARTPAPEDWGEPPILVPLELDLGPTCVSLFTTLTTFGTPRDVTLDELAIELFFPADDASEAILRPSATPVAAH
jgi:hypothetical protein